MCFSLWVYSRDGKALERFLQDYFDGNLKKYLKSEPIPEGNDGPVKVGAPAAALRVFPQSRALLALVPGRLASLCGS